jgi:hypothetical protein
MGRSALPRLTLSSGNVEALKWLALVLMTLDHVNTFLYDGRFPALFNMGRVAMPIFGFVLAYNLARPGALQNGVYARTMKRLALFGLLATPVYAALVGWERLNILFTLLLASAVMVLLENDGRWGVAAAMLIWAAFGSIVEYQWFGVLFCVAAWIYCRHPSRLTLSIWIAAAASFYAVNHNFWALAALPIIFAAARVRWSVPRLRHLFYIYYPAHLGILWFVQQIVV